MKPPSIIVTAIIVVAAMAGCGTTSRGASPASPTHPADARPTTTSTSTPTSSIAPDRPAAQTAPSSTAAPSRPANTAGRAQPGTVIATPSAGPVGTRVRIDGYGFTDAHWRAGGATNSLWLAGGFLGCDLFSDATHSVEVSADGHLSGDFVVPAAGDCRMTTTVNVALVPGRYQIRYQCTACTIGHFDVTTTPPRG